MRRAAGSRGWRAAGPLLAPLLLAAAPALTAAQQQAVARAFVCPGRLPGDAARFAAMQRFMARFEAVAPGVPIPARLAFHARLTRTHHCPPLDHELTYTFPQS